MGFENCEVGFGKKKELGNGIGTPPPPFSSLNRLISGADVVHFDVSYISVQDRIHANRDW